VNILWVCIQEGWDIPLYIAAGCSAGRPSTAESVPGPWPRPALLHRLHLGGVYYLASRNSHSSRSIVHLRREFRRLGPIVYAPRRAAAFRTACTEPVTLYGLRRENFSLRTAGCL